MNISKFLKSLALSLSIVAGLTACVYGPYYPGPARHSYHAHYYPAYYDYFFYPSVRVYFNYSTGHYYYPSGRRWIRSTNLPPHIHLDSRERVTTRIEGDKPYLKNRQHIQKYQPRPNFRPDPKKHKKERTQNLKLYKQHQKKQKKYEEEWIKRGKKNKWPN